MTYHKYEIVTEYETYVYPLSSDYSVVHHRKVGREKFNYAIYHNDVVAEIVKKGVKSLPSSTFYHEKWGNLKTMSPKYPKFFGEEPTTLEFRFSHLHHGVIFDENVKPLSMSFTRLAHPNYNDKLESTSNIDTRIKFSNGSATFVFQDEDSFSKLCRMAKKPTVAQLWKIVGLEEDHGPLKGDF